MSSQTMQHVADSWCNTIGSAAVLALSAFFYQNEVAYPNNSFQQKFATWYLEDNHFAFKITETEHPAVSKIYLRLSNLLTRFAF